MFELNGIVWSICFVRPYDNILYDYINDCYTVATTDFLTKTIYISIDVDDEFLLKILKHELYHCYEFSEIAYDLPLLYEEGTSNFIAMYGEDLIDLAYLLYNQLTYY